MIVDLHVHTCRYSGCSNIEPGEVLRRSKEVGLDGIVLTEHGILWRPDRLGPLQELAANQGLLLLAGEEVTCVQDGQRQDFLVLGMAASVGGSLGAEEMIRRVHAEGGIVIAAHPYKPSRWGEGYHGVGDRIYDLQVDAVEIFHPDHDELARARARTAASRLGIPMTGGSDAHEPYEIGRCGTRFARKVTSLEALIEEIREGRIEPVDGCPVQG